ncbi:hypothetical protein MPSEU_000767200 [Mayamaea pseudoterrestris]|nr:hypothetical protein MPSEU_000767200 [Mayamaea pseudoterrestris]
MALPIGARSIRQWFLLFVLLSVVFNFTFFLSKSTKEHLLSAADEPLAQQSTTANEQLHQHQNSFNACFSVNSPEWLQGARMGNVNDSSLLDLDILPPLSQRLDSFGHDYFLQDLLDQSICADGSRFRQFTDQQELQSMDAITDAAIIKQWTMRLVYWSMHYHQTRHARREAKHRQEQASKGIDCYPPASTVGPYDYECSNAKYIAIGLSSPIGLGANVRLGMINGYLHALIADRIVIWVNDSPVGSEEFLQVPWAQVSCDDGKRARRDTQCFFMPSTPCVLTEQDLEQAYFLTKEEADSMYDHGIPPAGHENDKVWQVRLYYWNQGHTPRLAAERLRNHSYSLIEEHFTSANDQFKKLLYQAADNILTPDPPRSGHSYPAANTKAHHALAVYALRPRRDKAKQMKDLLEDLKARNSIDSEFSVGLPVRATYRSNKACLVQVFTSAKHFS